MGTHPIFESDFDCLTEYQMAATETIYKVTKSQKGANEPVITVDGVFGEQHDYAQVVCRHLRLHCRVETEQLLASVLLKRDLVTRENLKELVDTVNKLIA